MQKNVIFHTRFQTRPLKRNHVTITLIRTATKRFLTIHFQFAYFAFFLTHLHLITAEVNKLLGLLKRSCPLLTKVAVRRSLYLAIVKPHLCYATEVWSPAQKSLKVKVEQVQRRATRWILSLKPGQMSYGERLLALDMLPLAYDGEIKDLVFFFKAVYGQIDIDVSDYVSFNNHRRTRRGQSAGCYLTFPACKTGTLQALYFVRIVKLWNNLSDEVFPSGFTSLGCFSLT